MNILTDSWIPVVNDGVKSNVNFETALNTKLTDFNFQRNDFFFSFLLMAIGIKNTSLDNAGVFNGDKRFMQDSRAVDGKPFPISRLPLGAPGESTILRNRDHFLKRNSFEMLCPCCATMALYSHTQFSGPQGAGIMPGNLSHQMLYLRSGDTLQDVIDANTTDDTPDSMAYFSYPNSYWLTPPKESGECWICGSSGLMVTEFRRAKGSSDFHKNPHCAKTKSGKRFSVDANGTMFEVISGASEHSEISISPIAINENANDGDKIIAFGTHYDKAFLQKMTFEHFILAKPFNNKIINSFIVSLWAIKYQFNDEINWSSSFVGEAKKSLYSLVENGKDLMEAALEIIDGYCPPSDSSNMKYISNFLEARNKFILIASKQS
ncbi:type I-E CRISPR-associated protein Cse1/CasA [Pluralibacter gergoviae]|uniref:type I-E CRISPR-associated protein Cse1/CasA n=1 Tax=Pluralibacter gergoviae TaxID=61647 RepID=UPI00290DC57E|nr:type I-E CRISPR-associated protein Cse1/CasA [Pluralibacter gergoviae]MDU4001420.1 hypothetical protein [Pluralibacter gergoviae]